MFEGLKLRMLLAKIQAELKAQYNDQQFVNRVCQLPPTVKLITDSWEGAYFRGTKVEPFLYVLVVLGEAVSSDLLSLDERNLCASLLNDRLSRVRDDIRFISTFGSIYHTAEDRLSEWGRKRASGANSYQTEKISDDSFIRGSGRYELRYEIELNQKIHGISIGSKEISGMRSDNLDGLKKMAFMHRMAGKNVEIIDLATGKSVAIEG